MLGVAAAALVCLACDETHFKDCISTLVCSRCVGFAGWYFWSKVGEDNSAETSGVLRKSVDIDQSKRWEARWLTRGSRVP